MNYLLTLAYDGTNYCGFQVQPNGRSVAAAFQDALEAVLGCRPDIKGCSRTDAGVHALGFMLNFHADTRIPAAKLPLALNQHLPPDIRALEARVVPDDFHARYAAHTKTYLYRIHNSPIDSPFAARYYTKVPGRLDADRMQQAAQYFVGKHDFLALCASGSSAAAHGDTVRTITACDVQRRGDDIDITVTADGYLYNMVRILAGTLCEAGAGRLAPEAVPGILASRDRKNAGPTLAAGILSAADWPWLFAVNVPIGLAALALSRRFLPENPVRVREHRFDWRDAVMNALTFGLMMASVEGFSHGLDPRVLSLGVAALIVVGFFFIRGQLREPYPILPFDLLRIPIFSVSVATSVCSFLGQMLAMVALPFYLQQACGYNDVETGLLLTAWPAVIMVVAPAAGLLVERIHAGLLGGTGLTMMAAGLFLLAFLPEHPTDFDIIWRLVLCGAGFGLFQSPNNSILIASAPPERSGSASGMLATARLAGQTTGAALMALLFHVVPENSTHTALLLAGGFAVAGAAVSLARIRLPLPEGLKRIKNEK